MYNDQFGNGWIQMTVNEKKTTHNNQTHINTEKKLKLKVVDVWIFCCCLEHFVSI